MWNASPVSAPPATSARIGAPRASACSAASTTSTPAASPNTKPSRSASNGPRRAGRVVVALRERAHVAERSEGDRQDGALGAAGDHDVRVAVLDQALGLDEGLHARRAGGHAR